MKIPHFLYILIVKFSCLYGTVDGLIRTISTGDVHWVVAEQHESQVDACGRIGKISLLFRNEYLPWNVEAFIDVVVNKLGRKVDRAAGSTGLLGCCVPGLWCGADGCFTQGYGPSFRNYGWLSNVTQAFPVFACSNDTTSSTDLAITSQSFSKGKLIVSGKGFQWDESSIRTMIGSEVCYEPELCYSEICNVCSASNPCPVGSICLTFAAEGTSFCFTSCEGLTDKSCPCDFSCYGIKIGEGTDELFVCAPERLRSNGNLCSNHVATDELRCRAPGMLQHPSLLSNKNTTMALSIAGDGDSEAIGTVLTVTSVCNSNSDCYDGNLCTIDKCEVGGVCSYQPIDSCGSIPDATKERSAPYVYYSHFSRNNSELFAFFVTQMDLLGDASPAEKLDDYPLTYVNLPFKIVYFGNLVTKAAISPNGVVGLEPLRECSRYQVILVYSYLFTILANYESDLLYNTVYPVHKRYQCSFAVVQRLVTRKHSA